ncbi:hypothetical protein QLX08_006369 [Tetragonisca angustula]
MENHEKVCQLLIKNINQLNESIKHSPYVNLFTTHLTRCDNHTEDGDFVNFLQNVLNTFHHFADECFEYSKCNEQSEETCEISHSLKVSNFYITHEVISACVKVPPTEAYECIRIMDEVFTSH